VPQPKWQYLIRDLHPGYISWARLRPNQKRLAENALALARSVSSAGARGSALLQGRGLCALWGRMGVHYNSRERPTWYLPMPATRGRYAQGTKVCQRVPGKVSIPPSAIAPGTCPTLNLEIALAVQQEVEARFVNRWITAAARGSCPIRAELSSPPVI